MAMMTAASASTSGQVGPQRATAATKNTDQAHRAARSTARSEPAIPFTAASGPATAHATALPSRNPIANRPTRRSRAWSEGPMTAPGRGPATTRLLILTMDISNFDAQNSHQYDDYGKSSPS